MTNPYGNPMMWAAPGPNGQYGPQRPQEYYGTGPGQMGPAAQGGQSPMMLAPGGQGNQYGYGNRPGGGYGYYEQETPLGSFAAANQQYAGGAPPIRAMGASNPYIGQNAQNIGNQGPVMPYAQQIAQMGQQRNPYLGGQTQQATAASTTYAGQNNHYVQAAVNSASQDATRNYQQAVAPQRDRQMAASGSFGNAGVQQMQLEDQRNLQGTLGNIATNAYLQDYRDQLGLGEAQANRLTSTSQFNSGLNAADLGRNMAGFFTGQGMGMQGLGQQLGAAQFDAGMGQRTNEFNVGTDLQNLGRNSGLAQNLGMFNAGQMNNMGQFNANLGQQNSQFNAGQGNAMNMFNAGQGNSMLGQARNLNENARQFDTNMDFNSWQANNNVMRQGQQDQMRYLDWLFGMQGKGLDLANQQQNAPLNYWQQFAGAANQAGGMGGSTGQELQGNPWLGGLGGWQLFNKMFPNGFGG